MKILQLAFRNLWRHPQRTLFISSLVVIGSLFITMATAILDGATKGLETSLVGSLTGHLTLAAPTEEAYGLFGSEIPIVSDYEGIPAIDEGKRIFPLLGEIPGVSAYTSIVSCIASVSLSGFTQKSVVFGIDPATYFSVLSDIEILWGDPGELNRGGIFLNERWAKQAETQLKRPPAKGDSVVAAVASRGTFRLRTFYVAGVYRYKAPSDTLDRVVLADPTLVRSLVNYTLGNGSLATEAGLDNRADTSSGSIDDLFAVNQDIESSSTPGISLQSVESTLQDTKQRDSLVAVDHAAWSFILIRKDEHASIHKVKSALEKVLKKNNVQIRILDWYTAAGSNALMLFALKAAFNVGVLFLVLGSLMMLINSLVISVLERTGEIGTLRALGAKRFFIIRLIVMEILVMSLGSAGIGIIITKVLLHTISSVGIVLKNPLLIGLFGGALLRPQLELSFVCMFFIGILLASLVASIYPIYLALSISPREAIHEGEG